MAEGKPVKSGFYRIELNKSTWDVPHRYQEMVLVAAGTFGQVCKAIDTLTSEKVAVKKLHRPFQSEIHAKRAFRELRILKHMHHDNVIGLLDVFTSATSFEDFDDLYLVSQYMPMDLRHVIRSQPLSDDHICLLTYQILRALKYIHSAGIIHRDLKPNNIIVNEEIELKILDFGLARHVNDEMTGYVAQRWYRAPEIMLNWMHYSQTVDIWSVGCIMAEMCTGKTLFKGGDYIEQLTRILALVGTPDDIIMNKISSLEARRYVQSMPKVERKDFNVVFEGANPKAIDLLEKMLTLDADVRITAADALSHPYLSPYHDPLDEPTAEEYDSYGSLELSMREWKRMTYGEVCIFVPPPLPKASAES